jgi:(p)ppGpp synthase/HD superfamily hydrolase
VYKNLPSKDRQGGPDRSLADISAWRGIMDTPNIYQLVEFWKSNNSSYFELAQFSDGKTVKDYIIEPKKKNGYQSVHILLRLKGEENVHEGQLRTYQMERKAVVGKAAHSGHIGEKLETVADYCSPQEIKFISSALGHTIDPAMLK